MMRSIAVFFLCCLNGVVSFAQCNTYRATSHQIFHANDIRTVINQRGNMFYSLEQRGFQVPFTGSQSEKGISVAGVWIGGFDENGSLKMASALYGDSYHADFIQGPLTPSEFQLNDNCVEWDTIWSVTRYETLLHIQDYEEDGAIDNPQRAIFGWPGVGNAFFESVTGLQLPATDDDYAPFFDKNSNAIYEPDLGEYPLPYGFQPLAIPDQITWHIFNDHNVHTESQGDPLHVEVQQTCYAFQCDEETVLNRALFVDFHVIFRDTITLDSVYFSLWEASDLGNCGLDDRIGCSPQDNATFIYNHDGLPGSDEFYCNPINHQQGPGVFSLSYLNRNMSSSMYYANGSVGPWPNAMTDPQSGAPLEYYRLMTGSWKSGAPLTLGGTGYNTDPGQTPTMFAFPGNPNDSTSWAMSNENIGYGDFRTVSSTKLGQVEPGNEVRISMAFALHLDTTLNHAGNIGFMFEELPYLKSQLATGFPDCMKSLIPCTENCVWPGDANHDGVANNLDALQLGLAYNKTGTMRYSPLSWAPHKSKSWSGSFHDGLNWKHADMNGDGIIDFSGDIDILKTHYGLTYEGYQQELICNAGNEIIVEGGFVSYHPTNFQSTVYIHLNSQVIDSLYGLAYTIVYDTFFFYPFNLEQIQSPFERYLSKEFLSKEPGRYGYAVTQIDGHNIAIDQDEPLASFLLPVRSNDMVIGKHDTATLCLANIRGVLKDGTVIPMGANSIQFVFLDEYATSVSDVALDDISVYPNPSSGSVYFEVPSELVGGRYELRSISGQLIYSGMVAELVSQLDMSSGMYLLLIFDDDHRIVKKIVVIE